MKVTIVEGTVDEIRSVFPSLGSGMIVSATPQGAGPSSPPEESNRANKITTEVARAFLTRIPLAESQLKALQLIYRAHPGTISGTELQEHLGITRAQFSGFMGAFGRRLTHTEGWVDGSWMFDQKWDGETNHYSLPAPVREAMELENLV